MRIWTMNSVKFRGVNVRFFFFVMSISCVFFLHSAVYIDDFNLTELVLSLMLTSSL
jgi:hypothetical protein